MPPPLCHPQVNIINLWSNNDRKNQSSLAIVKKLDFTLLCAKYYLYINKLAPKDLSLDEFKAKISWRYDLEKPLPSIS